LFFSISARRRRYKISSSTRPHAADAVGNHAKQKDDKADDQQSAAGNQGLVVGGDQAIGTCHIDIQSPAQQYNPGQ